jgi:hypothetical protein
MSERPPTPVIDPDVLAFVSASIASVWELELLLLLHREPARCWTPAEIDRQLRASTTVVGSALRRLAAAELVAQPAREQFQYGPANPRVHDIVAALDRAYRTNPISVIKAIVGAPGTKLQIFPDAFRFKE